MRNVLDREVLLGPSETARLSWGPSGIARSCADVLDRVRQVAISEFRAGAHPILVVRLGSVIDEREFQRATFDIGLREATAGIRSVQDRLQLARVEGSIVWSNLVSISGENTDHGIRILQSDDSFRRLGEETENRELPA